MGYLKIGLGIGIGYVLGARAGRQRYEELLADARRLSAHPKVQETVEKLPPVLQQGLHRLAEQPTAVTGLTEAGIADPTPPSSSPAGLLEPEPEPLVVVELETDPLESLGTEPPLDPLVISDPVDLPPSSPRNLR